MSAPAHKTYILGDREYSNEDLALLSLGVACEKKATRPILLDLRHLGTSFTEYFAIVSAANNRQVYAIAEDVRMFFKTAFGLNPVAVDGLESATWVLIDYGFMFVHVFQEPTRALYQLEQLWGKARLIPCDEENYEPLFKQAQQFLSHENKETTSQAPSYS